MTRPLWLDSPLIKAARHQPSGFVPVWLMRQAGRYMADYRAIRAKTSFVELCRNPDLCAEVAVSAVQRLGVDAAILFSDLLLILEPMGFDLQFTANEGPLLSNPLHDAGDVDRVRELDALEPLDYVMQAVTKTRAQLPEAIPLLGFAGAPFTLASYAIEGGSSRSYRRTKAFMICDPGAWHALLEKLSRAVARYLLGQLAAGVQGVQLFDSWVGCLGPDDYRRFVLPHSRAVLAAMPADVPVIHFGTGNPALLPCLRDAGGNVLGVDWRVRLDDAWQTIGYERAVQGNLDPAVLLAEPGEIRRRVREILDQAGGRPGHIFNLGHGVLPETPLENVIALVEAVHEMSSGEPG